MAFSMLFPSMLLKTLVKSTVRRHDESVGRWRQAETADAMVSAPPVVLTPS